MRARELQQTLPDAMPAPAPAMDMDAPSPAGAYGASPMSGAYGARSTDAAAPMPGTYGMYGAPAMAGTYGTRSDASTYGDAATPAYGSRAAAMGPTMTNPAYGDRAVDAAGEEELRSDRGMPAAMGTYGTAAPAGTYSAPRGARTSRGLPMAGEEPNMEPDMNGDMDAPESDMDGDMDGDIDAPEPDMDASATEADNEGDMEERMEDDASPEVVAAEAEDEPAAAQRGMPEGEEEEMDKDTEELVPDVDPDAPWAGNATAVPCAGKPVRRHQKCAGVPGRRHFAVRAPCANPEDLCMVKNAFHAQCVSQKRYVRKIRQGWPGEVLACPKA